MRNAIAEKLNENPVIAAVAEPERLPLQAIAALCFCFRGTSSASARWWMR